MANKKLLAYRRFAGIGDWIMALSVLKMVNIQYPDIDIYLNVTAKNLHTHPREWRELPKLTMEIINNCDVKIQQLVHCKNLQGLNGYDYISGHMVYDKSQGKQFIESMVDKFNKRTGLNIRYDPNIYVKFLTIKNDKPIHKRAYVLMQACTKRKHATAKWKDYGYRNMCKIVERLKRYIDVIQIGDHGDLELPIKTKYLGVDLNILHNLMINALGFVGMDGMLGVYAAHNNVRQYIIYTGKFNMAWTKFRNRLQINGNLCGNQAIARLITEDLCADNSGKLSFA